MQTLYDACASAQKEIHILEGTAHGTDLITVPPEGGLGYASVPKTDEEAQERNELADLLLRFIGNTFTAGSEIPTETEEKFTEDAADDDAAGMISTKPADEENSSEGNHAVMTESETDGTNKGLTILGQSAAGSTIILALFGVCTIGVLVMLIWFKRK